MNIGQTTRILTKNVPVGFVTITPNLQQVVINNAKVFWVGLVGGRRGEN